MDVCAKCKVKKKEPFIGCEGTCNDWFHISCAGYSDAEYKLLERNKNIFFWCNTCRISCKIVKKDTMDTINGNIGDIKNEIDDIKNCVDDVSKQFDRSFLNNLLGEFSKKLMIDIEKLVNKYQSDTLKEIDLKLEKSHSSSIPAHNNVQTYASAASQDKSAFVLQPKTMNHSVTTTKMDMLHNINPIESDIAVSKVVSTKNGGVVIHCNKSESEKFKQLATSKLGDKYEVKQLPTLHPRVKIVGMSEKYDAEVLIKFIKLQNKNVVDDTSVCSVINIECLRKNSRIYQALIQVDIATYGRLMDHGKLFVGYDYCTIYDGIGLKRCYKCCNFNHIAKNCHEVLPSCPKCAGSHYLKECKSNDLKCILCSNFQAAHGTLNVDSNHACFDNKCPVYTEALKRYKHNILGGKK